MSKTPLIIASEAMTGSQAVVLFALDKILNLGADVNKVGPNTTLGSLGLDKETYLMVIEDIQDQMKWISGAAKEPVKILNNYPEFLETQTVAKLALVLHEDLINLQLKNV